jgi:ABC-type transport system substrate-binding protein
MRDVPTMRTLAWLAACLVALTAPAKVLAQGSAPLNSQAALKVLRYGFPVAETGFDPVQINDLYSSIILGQIFDPPYTYDFLARPAKVKPNTAAAMPEVSADGLTWTIRIRTGIYFSDDPAFKGRKRELTAQDYVYSLKRHYDPKSKSPNVYQLDKRIAGMDELRQAALKGAPFDYDREVEGLRALDRYTYRIRLTEPWPNLLYTLTYCNLVCAVAREVVEAAGDQIMERPVGTNAFRLAQWKRSSRMVLERNPNYRDDRYDEQAPEGDALKQAIAAKLKGRKLPMVDRVEIYVIEEAQPRWLAFLNGEHDLITAVPAEYINLAIPNGKLAPNLAHQGIRADRVSDLDLAFFYFGMEHPVVGGYTPEKVALRRAIALAFDIESSIRQSYRGQAIPAQSTVPPGSYGYDRTLVGALAEYSPARARGLLDTYGYVDKDGDGYRDMPDGKPLVLEVASPPDGQSKISDEVWRRSMEPIGIRIEFKKAKWPELLRESRAGRLMIWGLGWIAAIPDADPFYQILYGPNAGQSNHSRFNHPGWNSLFERARLLPDGPERSALYREMDKLFFAYAPLRPMVHRITTGLTQPWVIGYQRHPVLREFWKYIDIDTEIQARSKN